VEEEAVAADQVEEEAVAADQAVEVAEEEVDDEIEANF
jgi:hypothetical protein